MSIEIREEVAGDRAAIRTLHRQAFGQEEEANLVEALRANGGVSLSLVAIVEGCLVGHVLYSPATIGQVVGAGLGPLAVLPGHQRRGIGSQLVQMGNDRLRKDVCPFIIVLGHAGYYPRFGFHPASARGIRCQWEGVADQSFMLLVLNEPKMAGLSGVAQYRAEFSSLAYTPR